jgi:hypothetical protein
LLLSLNPYTSEAGEYRLGAFAFDIPGSWQVKATQTEIVATQGERKPIPNSLLKMEHCISTESRPCNAEMFFPPRGANLENYYCGESLPTINDHENGLKELRKICSVTSQGNATYIGMLYLTTGRNNLGLIVLFDRSSPVPAEFLDHFISSLAVK